MFKRLLAILIISILLTSCEDEEAKFIDECVASKKHDLFECKALARTAFDD